MVTANCGVPIKTVRTFIAKLFLIGIIPLKTVKGVRMPGNIIQINKAEELEWYVGDSKMEDLIAYLNKIGFPMNEDNPTSSDTSS